MKPLLAFGPMVIALYVAFLAVSVLLAPQWIDREKLAFPLVQLPLDLTKGDEGRPHLWRSLFRDRAIWLGAAIPIVCHSLNVTFPHEWYHSQCHRRGSSGATSGNGSGAPYRPYGRR